MQQPNAPEHALHGLKLDNAKFGEIALLVLAALPFHDFSAFLVRRERKQARGEGDKAMSSQEGGSLGKRRQLGQKTRLGKGVCMHAPGSKGKADREAQLTISSF